MSVLRYERNRQRRDDRRETIRAQAPAALRVADQVEAGVFKDQAERQGRVGWQAGKLALQVSRSLALTGWKSCGLP
jgi:hypothetical protein